MLLLRGDGTAIEQLDPFWVGIGRRSAFAYRLRRQWLYRRVESVEFVGRGSVRRRVSVDLEIPDYLPSLGDRAARGGRLVPVSVFAKWPPVMDFNLVGPDGHPASLYVRDTTVALDFGLVVGLAEQVLARARIRRTGRAPSRPQDVELSAALQELLAYLVAEDQPSRDALWRVAERLADELADALDSPDESVAREAAEMLDLAAQLEDHAVLWVPMTGSPGTDRVVKFSYLDRCDVPNHPWKRLLIACSWGERNLGMPLPHAGRHTRYHLNVAAPSGLELTRIRIVAFPGAKQVHLGGTAARGLDGIEASRIFDRQGHVYLAFRDLPSHRSYLQLTMAASRDGFISACVVAATVLALVLSATFPRLADAGVHLDSTVVLLAAVPVVLGYVLVRPTAHALERYHLAGVRVMALLAGSSPIAAALALVLTRHVPGDGPDVAVARPIWAGLVIASWFFVVGLASSWLFATKPISGGSSTTLHTHTPPPANPAARRPHPHRVRNRWTPIVVASGVCAAVGVVAGSLLECQPYSHVARGALAAYLLHRRAVVLIAVALVALGAIALYALLGGIWRVATKPQRSSDVPAQRAARSTLGAAALLRLRRFRAHARRGLADWAAWTALSPTSRHRLARLGGQVRTVLLLGSGIAWVWGTVAAASLTAWQTLSVTPHSDPARLAGIARVGDAVANATLAPAVVFVVVASARLLVRRDVFTDPAGAFLVSVSTAVAAGAIALRAVSVLWPNAVDVPPRLSWIAFAVWVGVVAVALRGALRRA